MSSFERDCVLIVVWRFINRSSRGSIRTGNSSKFPHASQISHEVSHQLLWVWLKFRKSLASPSRRRPLTANLKPKRMSNLDVKLTKTHFTINGLTSLGSHNNFNIAILSAAFNSISKAFWATPFLGKKSKRETTRTIISKSKSYHKSDEISSLILEADFTWEYLKNVNLHVKPCSFVLAFSHVHIFAAEHVRLCKGVWFAEIQKDYKTAGDRPIYASIQPIKQKPKAFFLLSQE